ncbi:hypothetical protein Tco_0712856, partial [Tanacetum coccineum]
MGDEDAAVIEAAETVANGAASLAAKKHDLIIKKRKGTELRILDGRHWKWEL